jgi:hypothetical protein
MAITLMLKTGREIVLRSKGVATSHQDWAHFEGAVFSTDTATKLLNSPAIDFELARTEGAQRPTSGKG